MYITLTKLKDIIRTNIGTGKVKKVFIGDPAMIPESQLPCIAIVPVSTETNVADTGRDKNTFNIDIVAIENIKNYFGKTPDEMIGIKALVDIMEERNSSGTLQSDTVLYQLRDNLTLGDNWQIDNLSTIEYSRAGEGRPRPEQLITIEASIRLTITRFRNR